MLPVSRLCWVPSNRTSCESIQLHHVSKAFNEHEDHTVWMVSLWVSLSASSPWKGIWDSYSCFFTSTVSEGTWTFLSGQIFPSNAWNASPIPLPMSTGEDLEKLVRLLENPWYAMMSLKLGGIETWSPSLLLWEDMVWMAGMLWYAMVCHGMVSVSYVKKHFTRLFNLAFYSSHFNVHPRFQKKMFSSLTMKRIVWSLKFVNLGTSRW